MPTGSTPPRTSLPVVPPDDGVAAALPPVYAAWVTAILGGVPAAEPEATCDDCAMCPPPGAEPEPGGHWFNPATKCCTYVPELANYLVGNALRDGSAPYAAGRATLRARIAARVGVSPLGLAQPEAYRTRLQYSPDEFGRNAELVCPHFVREDGGRCGVWQHREAQCATWFCKHERGPVSRAYWTRLHQVLATADRALATWCVRELDVGGAALALLFPVPGPRARPEALAPSDVAQTADRAYHAALWGRWAGREEAFYEACSERVAGMAWADVLAIGGSELAAQADLLAHARRAVDAPALPARLRVGQFVNVGMFPGGIRVQTYSFLDPLDLPRALVDLLPRFDGRPTADVLAEIAAAGVDLPREAVQKLVDFRVLVPVA